jgi:hypothetical protein
VDSRKIAEHLSRQITFLDVDGAVLSPADMLIQLLGLKPQVADGPTAPGITTWPSETVPALLFQMAKNDAADFIRRNHRLPNQVFLGAETLGLSDFTATLAAKILSPDSGMVRILHGHTIFERYFPTDAKGASHWPIPSKRLCRAGVARSRPAAGLDFKTCEVADAMYTRRILGP